MIQFKCPHCAHPFRVDDSYAGKHAKCSCGQRITVPGAAQPPTTQPVQASLGRPKSFSEEDLREFAKQVMKTIRK